MVGRGAGGMDRVRIRSFPPFFSFCFSLGVVVRRRFVWYGVGVVFVVGCGGGGRGSGVRGRLR